MNPNEQSQDSFTINTPRGGYAVVYYPSPERTEELAALRKV